MPVGGLRGLQFADQDLAEFDLHARAEVDLEPDLAGPISEIVHEVRSHLAVQLDDHVISLADYDDIVPVALADEVKALSGIVDSVEEAAIEFLTVYLPSPREQSLPCVVDRHVDLVPRHSRLRESAADLNSGIGNLRGRAHRSPWYEV